MSVLLRHLSFGSILLCILFTGTVHADECSINNRNCILKQLEQEASAIKQTSWRDQTYRELAKTLAFDGKTDQAITFIDKIETPDTKAMTIRGIAMATVESKQPAPIYQDTMLKLRGIAEKISHPPSYAIALTYIAMAQAFATDHDGAWKTASDMKNDALRHKAYGETAEIQAEQSNFIASMKSISFIESEAFRNKSYALTSKIFADQKQLSYAYKAALNITNSYKKSKALQYILDSQKSRESKKID